MCSATIRPYPAWFIVANNTTPLYLEGSQLGMMPKALLELLHSSDTVTTAERFDTRTSAFGVSESWGKLGTVAKDGFPPLLSRVSKSCVVVSECWSLSHMPVLEL